MNRYLKQYEEAKNGGHMDKDGDIILISPFGVPVPPTLWLKVEFAVINIFSKINSFFLDFRGRMFGI